MCVSMHAGTHGHCSMRTHGDSALPYACQWRLHAASLHTKVKHACKHAHACMPWLAQCAPGHQRHLLTRCTLQGQWSIGIFKGASLFDMQPLEKWTLPAHFDRTYSNPVFTCAHMSDTPASFVADPFLWPQPDASPNGKLFMFFETKSLHNMQGDIGAAVSSDGGFSFQPLGVVLDEPWHLSYPFVFAHKGAIYMVPEGSKSRTLRLYKAVDFPKAWAFER
jgi:hypothetical protein